MKVYSAPASPRIPDEIQRDERDGKSRSRSKSTNSSPSPTTEEKTTQVAMALGGNYNDPWNGHHVF